jgi:DNA modification methylase
VNRSGHPPGSALRAPLLSALAETGAIGSTVRQLSARVDYPSSMVSEELESLRDGGNVLRMGRGLWILTTYSDLGSREDFVDPVEFVERFVADGGPSLGSYAGPITFSANDQLPVHRWWPYVQGYSAEFVAELIERSPLRRGATILDPFAGSGTTLVEARKAGFRTVGHEILPPAALAARVKTHFELSGRELAGAAERLFARARARGPGAPPFLRETPRHFDPSVLRALTKLRDALPPAGTGVGDALRLAFGASLIPVSRLRRSPCLGYAPSRPLPSPDPFEVLRGNTEMMRSDLAGLAAARDRWGPPTVVHPTDARSIDAAPGSVDLAVTSPPYVNGMDYVMNYKLDMAWLGYASSYADLADLRQTMVSCDNLPRQEAARYVSVDQGLDPWLSDILTRIRSNVAQKGSYRRQDAHGIVRRYFQDLLPVLQGVYRALAPGGRFVLVVGDSLMAGAYIPGDLILARMGRSVGFRMAGVEVARPRRSGQRRSFVLRESVVTLEKPGGRGAARQRS